MSIFDKFNKSVDLEGMKKDVKEVEENGGGGFEDVPFAKYEVAVDKMEVKATKNGDKLMLSIVFKVVDGSYKGRLIFYNQVIMSGFGIHNASEMLRSLKPGFDIIFEDYNQYAELVSMVQDAVKDNFEYLLDYNENDKKFKTYSIEEVYED